LKHSRDSERDLNFTWNLGLQLAMLNDINNYSGIILNNRKQHIPATATTEWQHVFVWAFGSMQDYQQRRMKGSWVLDLYKIANHQNACCLVLLESSIEMPLEEPMRKAFK